MEIHVDGKIFYRYIMPAIESNMYILTEGEAALVVDPNINWEALALLQERRVRKVTVLLTHEHFDHISGVNWLRGYFPAEVICSAECAESLMDPVKNEAKFWEVLVMDKPREIQEIAKSIKDESYTCTADRTYEGQITLDWHGYHIRMIQAPGHSGGGSLIWIDEAILFTGDNLVNGTGVICKPPYGSKRDYSSITRPILEALPDEICILPGHGSPGNLSELRRYLDFFGKSDRENQIKVRH